ncbi:MAG: hypothetical protein ACOCZB_08580 [Spirochaetota bacterium]
MEADGIRRDAIVFKETDAPGYLPGALVVFSGGSWVGSRLIQFEHHAEHFASRTASCCLAHRYRIDAVCR